MKYSLFIIAITVFCHWGHSAPTDTIIEVTTVEPIAAHLRDIVDLLPKDLMKTIAHQHLKTDEEFKAAVKYMQSEEWVNLVETVRDKTEWVELKKFLKDAGINLDIIIRCVESFAQNVTVTLEPKEPPTKKSFKSFIIDVEQNVPTVKILAALHEKISKGVGFQELFEKLSSDESRKLVEAVIGLPEIKRMIKILADMDINLADMLSLMYIFFGWGEFKLA